MAEKRWEKGCASMLPVTGIFAGLSGGLLVNIALGPTHAIQSDWRCYTYYSAGVLAFLALFQFVRIGEKFADALDERSIVKYVDGMHWFNLAVVAIFLALAAFVLARGPEIDLARAEWPWYVAAFFVAAAPVWPGPWFFDAIFLCGRRSDSKYVDESQFRLNAVAPSDGMVLSEDDAEWNRWVERLQGDA